jgi:hypothetical protein
MGSRMRIAMCLLASASATPQGQLCASIIEGKARRGNPILFPESDQGDLEQ